MEDTIYAIKGDANYASEILSSLKVGEGRFGWSYVESANLRTLTTTIESKGWGGLSKDEQNCYQGFLLDFHAGDYVVYINVPEWGQCTVARVTGEYRWRWEDDDFNHRFPVDPETVHVFDRNDAVVHPALSSRLKLQGRWWRIYLQDEFAELLANLKRGGPTLSRTPQSNLRRLSNEMQESLTDITRKIHRTHPNTDLEVLLADVFKNIPGVIDAWRQGGAGDHGADIVVRFNEGFPIAKLEKESILVVQVKSFEGDHWDAGAVNDIRRAFEYYPEASAGLIVSTADSMTKEVEDELDKLKEESDKPVAILIGSEVAAFLLRYGAKLLA